LSSVLGRMAAELLYVLLSNYSPTFHEGEAVKALKEFVAEKLQYDNVWTDESGNLIAKYGSGTVRVALIGHIDTVPGPLKVEWRDGVLKGRGAVDAKGPLSAAFVGASQASKYIDGLQVYVIAAVGEEGPSHGAQQLIKDRWRFDQVIILEPTNTSKVVIEYRGSSLVSIECSSPGGHSSTPWAFSSACDKLFTIYSRAKEISGETRSSGKYPVISLVKVSCGETANTLPQHGETLLNLRIPYGMERTQVEEMLNDLMPEGCTYRLMNYTPPVKSRLGGLAPRALMRALIRQGIKPTPARKLGTSDMNLLYRKVTSDIAAYGPGKSELSHTNQEEITLKELKVGATTYMLALKEISEHT